MRSTHRTMLATAVLVAAAGSAAAQQGTVVRIAYVNPQAVFNAAPGRADAEAAYKKETDGYTAELKRMSDALTAMVSDYQKNESKMLAPEKERRERAIQAKEDSLRERQQQLSQQANERQSQLMAPIMEAVRKVLEDIRQEDGYAMILSHEPGNSPILVADKNLDVTDRVIARLKTLAAIKPAPGTKAGAPAATPSGVARPKPPGE